MHPGDTHPAPPYEQVRAHRAARLQSREPDGRCGVNFDVVPNQKGIAVPADRIRFTRERNMPVSRMFAQHGERESRRPPAESAVRLLQGDDIRIQLRENRKDALRVAPAVGANGLANVVAGDSQLHIKRLFAGMGIQDKAQIRQCRAYANRCSGGLQVALKVIGAGLGRTGTMSLKLALEHLGLGPCHHMTEVMAHPEQVAFWNRAAMGENVDWEEVYGSYSATVDWPGCHFYKQLADRYPDAKVVLSIRDAERWYESMSETILKSMEMMGLTQGDPPEDHPLRFGGIIIWQKAFNRDLSRNSVIAGFERHAEAVRTAIPSDRLLEFEAKQGWKPLCDFLDVPVPEAEFPRTNSREEFWEHASKAGEVSEAQRSA